MFLLKDDLSLQWTKFSVTGRNFLSLKAISCQRKTFPVTERIFGSNWIFGSILGSRWDPYCKSESSNLAWSFRQRFKWQDRYTDRQTDRDLDIMTTATRRAGAVKIAARILFIWTFLLLCNTWKPWACEISLTGLHRECRFEVKDRLYFIADNLFCVKHWLPLFFLFRFLVSCKEG